MVDADRHLNPRLSAWDFRGEVLRRVFLGNSLSDPKDCPSHLSVAIGLVVIGGIVLNRQHTSANDMFPNQIRRINCAVAASRVFMRTISNDQTTIELGCACSSERVLRQGFSG
jgi:hypothetical protein